MNKKTENLMALATRMVERALANDSLGLDSAKGALSRALDAALPAPCGTCAPGSDAALRHQVDDLAVLVSRLAYSLKKADPGTNLPARATDYLQRSGLTSPLRVPAPATAGFPCAAGEPGLAQPTCWIELKTDAGAWDASAAGRKTFEIRLDDRGYQPGYGLCLRKTRYTGADMRKGAPLVFVGDPLHRLVTHVMRGPIFGLAEGWAILSTTPVAAPGTTI